MDTTPARVTRSVRLDLDREAAWDLVGTQAGLARWLGGEVERIGRVIDVEDGSRLAFAWATDDGDASTVTLTVEDDGDGSRVTVVEERAGGSVAACLDAGAAWDHRLLHLEVGALALRSAPAFAGLL